MTTVAFDGVRLAADKRQTRDGQCSTIRKLWYGRVTEGGFIAGGGDLDALVTAVNWFRLINREEVPKPTFGKDDGFTFLHVYKHGGVTVCDEYGPALVAIRIYGAFHAIGSGTGYALAAMRLGQTAVEAIKIAAEFDAFTSAEVDVAVIDDGIHWHE